ncbi:MAG TPA: orotidine-5'-phosphate decarboxylase [Ignavibacteriales bacterium]|nr:orotidine-5'-phosphate decarboxylase [Ignavibacteriales bacterium]
MTSQEKLQKKLNEGKHITVGLDTDIKKIPKHLLSEKDPVLKFNEIIIENTSQFASSYKLNLAFYEKEGSRGLELLQKTLELIPKDILTIGDAKRGDIGNTSQMYAQSIFEHFKFDSVTLHPYMGFDSVEPFLQYEERLSFMLALTSNPGSKDFEKLELKDGRYLYQEVISKVKKWNSKNNCGIVFGATNEKELSENVGSFDDLFVLLPGIGAQGGSLEAVVEAFKESKKEKFLINVSRGLIYKDNSPSFGRAAKEEIISLNIKVAGIWN